MGKKRVHEIAKELKALGIEMDNKELVNELVSLDFDVTSHSSSLDEDQASVALEKIVAKRRPKAAVAPVAAAGFVVRRKRVEPTISAAPEPAVSSSAPQAAIEPAEQEEAREDLVEPTMIQPEPEPRFEAEEAAPEPEEEAPSKAAALSPAPEAKGEPEPTPERAPEVAAEVVAKEQREEAAPPPTPETKPAAAPTVAAPPAPPPVVPPAAPPAAPLRPTPGRAVVIPGRVALGFVPPVRTPGGARPPAPGASRHAPGGSRSAYPGRPAPGSRDPRALRPTENQAVVISRPDVPVRRVTPSSDAHKQIPMAPGPRAIGSVREFKVGTDQFGRRELTDVSKDVPGKSKRGKTDVKESLSKQELIDLARGRTTLPLRAGKKKKPIKKGAKTQITTMSEEKKVVEIEESITINEFSKTLGVKASELIRKLFLGGKQVTINSAIDADTAELLASDYGWRVERKGFEIGDYISEEESSPEKLMPRPPIVTIMGHVDHGKTSLLDAIRKANVAEGEAGGITQHIGAYSVATPDGRRVTFLDTPGHEAFTAMRARGAKVTDLVVIVVAADDGVMPQTREAINHAKAAEVPILVAINKMDKPSANPQHVKNQLMEFGLVSEELGGDTIMVPVSAKARTGIPELLEMILLQSEVLDLKADPERPAKGSVVEAKLDKGRGPVATVIVQEGTLRVGDALITGTQYGRVRAMLNDHGERIEAVLPGAPVEVLGLSGVPTAGDDFFVVEDEAAAQEISVHRIEKEREAKMAKTAKKGLEFLSSRVQAGDTKELKLIVKADVQGSVEAVCGSLEKLSTPKVKVTIIDSGVGGIRESDVMLAAASDGVVVGFNVRPEPKTTEVAAQQGVEIRMYGIIYEAVDEIRRAMEGLLEPTRREKVLGRAEVRNTFTSPKAGTIAGCAVVDGKMSRSAQVRLLRDSRVVYTGKVGSLRRFKDDVREVASGFECGLSIENYSDIKQGDVIEAFEIEEIRATL